MKLTTEMLDKAFQRFNQPAKKPVEILMPHEADAWRRMGRDIDAAVQRGDVVIAKPIPVDRSKSYIWKP